MDTGRYSVEVAPGLWREFRGRRLATASGWDPSDDRVRCQLNILFDEDADQYICVASTLQTNKLLDNYRCKSYVCESWSDAIDFFDGHFLAEELLTDSFFRESAGQPNEPVERTPPTCLQQDEE